MKNTHIKTNETTKNESVWYQKLQGQPMKTITMHANYNHQIKNYNVIIGIYKSHKIVTKL